MSGGSLDYVSYRIDDAADEIESYLCGGFSEKTEECLKEAVKTLRKASVYAHRVEWFLSDDDEESFHRQLEEELKELENKQ